MTTENLGDGGDFGFGFEQADEVLVVDGFLAVGEFGETAVDGVEFGVSEIVAELDEAMFEGAAAAVLAEDERVVGYPRPTPGS